MNNVIPAPTSDIDENWAFSATSLQLAQYHAQLEINHLRGEQEWSRRLKKLSRNINSLIYDIKMQSEEFE